MKAVTTPDLDGAARKIRQARYFLASLEQVSRDLVVFPFTMYTEPLDFCMSACLSAAQSAYYVLDETGGAQFQQIQAQVALKPQRG